MYSKPLTTLQRNANKINKKRTYMKEEKRLCRNEIKLLEKITKFLPEEIASHIYSFVNNDIKFNLSHYKTIFTKFICDFNKNKTKTNLSIIFKGYTDFNYCSHEETIFELKEMLYKVPFEKLKKFILFGTPSKYFNIAFPDEPSITEYIAINYKSKAKKSKDIDFQRKNFAFEILDLISYFSTKANEWHAFHIKNKNNYLSHLKFINQVCSCTDFGKILNTTFQKGEEICKENELITKKLVISILHLYDKYGEK